MKEVIEEFGGALIEFSVALFVIVFIFNMLFVVPTLGDGNITNANIFEVFEILFGDLIGGVSP